MNQVMAESQISWQEKFTLAVALIKYLGYKEEQIKNVSDLDLVNFRVLVVHSKCWRE